MAYDETTSSFREARNRRAVLSVLCAVLVLACPLGVALDDGNVIEEDEAVLPVLVVPALHLVGALITMAVAAYATYTLTTWSGDGSVPDGTLDDSVNATLRELQAQLVTSNYDTASGIWSKLAVNDAQLWSFVEAYFDLQAETAAASLWTDEGTYDGDRILERSSLIYNSLIYNYNITSTWNEFSQSWSGYRGSWATKGDAYDSMRVSFDWDGHSWTSDGVFSAELLRMVSPTSTSFRVYVDVVDQGEEGWSDRTNIMYAVGGPGSLTSASTGRTYQLSEGENDLAGMGVTSGWYELGLGTSYMSQNLHGSVSADGLMPTACMLLRNGSGYAHVYETGGSYVIVRDGISSVSSSLALGISYSDRNGGTVTSDIVPDLGLVLSSYSDVSDAINHAALSANYAGEAAWNVYDRLGESSALLKPSSITSGTQVDTPLTSAQAAVMYLAAMEQMAELGEGATPDGILVSGESLGMYCYGDIYYEGVLIAEDAVFTPFVYSDATLSVGSHRMDVEGLAMVWATGIEDLEAWDGVTEGSSIIGITGATLDILNIVNDDTEVSSLDLDVVSMERLGLIGFDVPDVPDTPRTIDVVPLLQLIVVLIGAVVALAGLFVRNPWLMLIGIVAAVVGYFLAGTIAGMIW